MDRRRQMHGIRQVCYGMPVSCADPKKDIMKV
jgi:hypothetical protein